MLIDNLLPAIPADKKRGWEVKINGQTVADVRELDITSKLGHLRYAWNPAGYDQWAFEELGGGGSVIVPFCRMSDQILIGVVAQKRSFQAEEPVLNMPRGFMDPNENHFKTAVRESGEEIGCRSSGSR